MAKQTILYLHGFASSGQGTKAQFFQKQFQPFPAAVFEAVEFNPTPRDFEYMTVSGLINRLRQYVLDRRPARLSLIGSSLGGLVAVNYAHRFGGVEKMLLLAPALRYRIDKWSPAQIEQWQRDGFLPVTHYAFGNDLPLRYAFHEDGLGYRQPAPPELPVQIIHGRGDEVVPIEGSREYAAAYPDYASLIEVDAGHQLNDRLDLIWSHLKDFLLDDETPLEL